MKKRENEQLNFTKVLNIFNKLWIKILITGVLLLVIFIVVSFKTSKEGKRTIITKSELVSVSKKNNLNTAEYVYNGVAVKKNDDGKKVYYVNYNGTVVAGTNLDDMKITQDDKNKKIVVQVPEVTITEIKIDNKNLDIIFLSNKYNTETVHAEAYGISKEDLSVKAKANKNFIDKAQEKSDSIIKALIKPLIDADGRGYELVIERSE